MHSNIQHYAAFASALTPLRPHHLRPHAIRFTRFRRWGSTVHPFTERLGYLCLEHDKQLARRGGEGADATTEKAQAVVL